MESTRCLRTVTVTTRYVALHQYYWTERQFYRIKTQHAFPRPKHMTVWSSSDRTIYPVRIPDDVAQGIPSTTSLERLPLYALDYTLPYSTQNGAQPGETAPLRKCPSSPSIMGSKLTSTVWSLSQQSCMIICSNRQLKPNGHH